MRGKLFNLPFFAFLFCLCLSINAQQNVVDSSQLSDSEDVEEYSEYPENRDERVIKFHADIDLQKDNYMEVTEYVRIYARGNVFKRGLRRVIPQERYDQYGHRKEVPIYLQDIRCNGEKSPWHSEESESGSDIIVYIGDSETYLEEGVYDYTIRYIAPGHIGQFEDHDEIYWNLNGFGWDVPFDTLSATVTIPDGTKLKKCFAYTGAYGETGNDCSISSKGNKAMFYSTRTFSPGENMTVCAQFSKGSQAPLTWWDIWQDDVFIWGMFAIFALFCIISWVMYGIDPKMPTVVPQYTIPRGLTPTMAGRIMGSSEETLTMSTIISMVIKGAAKIERVSKKEFKLIKQDKKGKLDQFEQLAFSKLFSEKQEISTETEYEEFADARKEIKEKSDKEYNDGAIYEYNSGSSITAIILFIAFGSGAIALNSTTETFWGSGILASIIFIWHFIYIGKYTLDGIHIRAEVEGLKMYIRTAEELQMKELTPEHFEELLPYAMVFGIENKWCKQFENVLKKCNYEPSWYSASDSRFTYASLLTDGGMRSVTSGFTSATKSSFSTYDRTQSSSSGGSWSSGGGGFSGGGGGGGGGGGW